MPRNAPILEFTSAALCPSIYKQIHNIPVSITTAMPLGEKEGLLIGAGISLSLATTYFYRQRQTLPFKWAHFLAWPVLGTGILLALSPSHDQMAESLRREGIADESQQAAARIAANEQLAAIRQKAAESKPFRPSV